MEDMRTYTGLLVLDLRLPHAESIKDRRKVLRSLLDRLRGEDFAVAQIPPTDLKQRAFAAVAAVSGAPSVLDERLDRAEQVAFASGFEVRILRRDTSVWSDNS